MPVLIVVSGPPGAGKSTVAGILASRFERSALVAGDDFFAFIASGRIAPWLSEAHQQNEIVIRAAAGASGTLALGGYTVVYDGVLGPWSVPTFAEEAGIDLVHYVVLMPTEEVCIARVTSRSGHSFSDLDATRHMYREFEMWRVEKRHVIVNHGRPVDAVDEVVRRLQARELEWSDSSVST